MVETITPMLGDVELPTIQHVTTLERRVLVEHHVPGMAGSAIQDLGRSATRIRLHGILFGADSRTGLEALRAKFHAGEPIPFTADIATATEIVDVLIDDLRVVEHAGRPNTFAYAIVLRESPPPPPPPNPLAGVSADILDDAQGLFDQAVSLTEVISGLDEIPEFGDPTRPLSSLLDDAESAIEQLPDALDSLASLIGEPPGP